MRVFYLLHTARSALFRASDHAMRRREGITVTQYSVLAVLLAEDRLPVSKIATTLKMGKSSLTTMIDRMEKLDLVRREKCSEDGRVSNVIILEAGKAVALRAAKSVRFVNSQLLESFSESEQKAIERFLEHVSNNAEKIVQSTEIIDRGG